MEQIQSQIQAMLFAEQDLSYRDFQAKLIPGVPAEQMIGVRTPILRRMAKSLSREPNIGAFLDELPHAYFDEYNLHGLIVAEEKEYETTIRRVDALLPYVNNWATCDLLSPKSFRKNKGRLIGDIDRWLSSAAPFTARFGIEMLMSHFLDDDFLPCYLDKVAAIRREEYYVNMMIAWYFATALAKQWDAALPFLTENRLPVWSHNKTIQKAVESYRISAEQKEFLRTLKR